MAWTKVECRKCKKEFEVQLYGKIRDRDYKVEHYYWLCDECKAEKREKELEEAKEKSREMKLPELTGSEKQVNWALKIRMEAIKAIEKQLEVYKLNPEDKPTQEEFLTRLGLTELLKETRASWWIDYRDAGWGVVAIRKGKKYVEEQAKKNSVLVG